jgi:signal transduction histidine kinase
VAQLLDLSRLEAGTIPLQREPFAARELLDDAARESRVHTPGTPVVVDADPGLLVDGDRERVHQVVANLLENAVRFTPPGGAVQLVARDDGGSVRIEVLDDGPGIGDDDTDRVFERFYRADHARASISGGAGLGLAIARWIVDLHGGDIHAERRQPTGCRVVFRLPRSNA